jgi:ferredoxin
VQPGRAVEVRGKGVAEADQLLPACAERGVGGAGSPGPGASESEAICKEGTHLTYVIAEPCIGEKDNSCVEVCPVDCIHPTPDEPDYDRVEQLYIDPDECIDCDACVEACPVDACFAEDQLPEEWAKFTAINAEYYTNR